MSFVTAKSTIFLFFLFSVSSAYCAPSSYLPINHRAYNFIERMENKLIIDNFHSGTKPALRTDIAGIIYSINEKKTELTKTEISELDYLLKEFSDDMPDSCAIGYKKVYKRKYLPEKITKVVYTNDKNFYSEKNSYYSFFLDPVVIRNARIAGKHSSGDDDNVYTSSNGFILRGTIGKHIGFHTDVRDSKEWGSRTYPESNATTLPGKGYAKFLGDTAEYDETFAHINYTSGPFVISYERGRNVWGRGKTGTLMLSNYGAPYDMVKGEATFGKFKFIFFTGELDQYPPIAEFYYNNSPGTTADSLAVKKHISAHRLEINLTHRLSLGFQETVIYGGRLDLTYLNPLMFLKGGEHTNGDHDNSLMGADFRALLHKNVSLYGELLIDDITTSKLGSGWYGNKLGYQIGTFITSPAGLDMDTRLEYTRLTPWVYTHTYPINSYTHYGDVLGHYIGPNSDQIFAAIEKRFSQKTKMSAEFLRIRHGANTSFKNVGGDPLTGFKKGDSKEAVFLDGDLHRTNSFSVNLSHEIYREFFIETGWTKEILDGDGIDIFNLSLSLNK